MKYCVHCGNELLEQAVVCVKCGCSVESHKNNYDQPVSESSNDSTLKTVAFVFMIISTCILGLWLFPLAWMIPMTVTFNGKVKRGEPISTGFKVCILLFLNMIAGILLLCDND